MNDSAASSCLPLRVHSITFEAQGVNSYEFRPTEGEEHLPSFTAGAHIDVGMPGGLARSYSLINPQGERHRYVIAVSRDPKSRGGSRYMHDDLRVGDVLQVTGPRNNFPLAESAGHSVLLAGGIGVTPIFAMVQRLSAQGRSWELHYSARSRKAAAFVRPLAALARQTGSQLHLNFDDETGRVLDVGSVVAAAPADAHFYACGPEPMLAAFELVTRECPADRVHVERFGVAAPGAPAGAFKVVLARSGAEIVVPPGKTILQALLEAGIDAPHSCMAGVCGTCETRVLAGVPDHRDFVLGDDQRKANEVIMICCSGCKGASLVLDL